MKEKQALRILGEVWKFIVVKDDGFDLAIPAHPWCPEFLRFIRLMDEDLPVIADYRAVMMTATYSNAGTRPLFGARRRLTDPNSALGGGRYAF